MLVSAVWSTCKNIKIAISIVLIVLPIALTVLTCGRMTVDRKPHIIVDWLPCLITYSSTQISNLLSKVYTLRVILFNIDFFLFMRTLAVKPDAMQQKLQLPSTRLCLIRTTWPPHIPAKSTYF